MKNLTNNQLQTLFIINKAAVDSLAPIVPTKYSYYKDPITVSTQYEDFNFSISRVSSRVYEIKVGLVELTYVDGESNIIGFTDDLYSAYKESLDIEARICVDDLIGIPRQSPLPDTTFIQGRVKRST